MGACIVQDNNFKGLVERSGLNSVQLEAKMLVYMDKNKTDILPTLDQLGIQSETAEKVVQESTDAEVDPEQSQSSTYSVQDDYSILFGSKEEADKAGAVNEGGEEFVAPEKESSIFDKIINEFSNETEYDDLKKSQYKQLVIQLMNQRRHVARELGEANRLKKKAKSEDRAELESKTTQLQSRIDELTDQIRRVVTSSNAKDLVGSGHGAVSELQRILDSEALTADKLNYAKLIINFWKAATNSASSSNPLFKDNRIPKSIKDEMDEIAIAMNDIDRKIEAATEVYALNFVREAHNRSLTKAQILKAISDISSWHENVRSLKDVDDHLVTAVAVAMDKADFMASKEYQSKITSFKDKVDKARSVLKSLSKNGNLFHALLSEKNGQYNGLVTIFKPEYWEEKMAKIEEAQESKDPKAWGAVKKWLDENELVVDYRLLLPDAHTKALFLGKEDVLERLATEHKSRLVKLCGERYFEILMSRAKESVYDYGLKRDAMIALLKRTEMSEDGINLAIERWEKSISPYWEVTRRLGHLNADGTYGSKNVREERSSSNIYSTKDTIHPEAIPLEKWKDPKFASIQSNATLYDLYNELMDIMSDARAVDPRSARNAFGFNYLPYFKKTITESFGDGLSFGFKEMFKVAKDSLLDRSKSTSDFSERDAITGKKVKGVRQMSFFLTKNEVEKAVNKLEVAHFIKHGKSANEDEVNKMREDVVAKLNSERSFDLEDIIPVFIAGTTMFKHKQANADAISLVKNFIVRKKRQSVLNQAGESVTDAGDVALDEEGLTHLNSLLEFTVDNWLGQPTKKVSGVSKGKTYTGSEQEQLNAIVLQQQELQRKLDKNEISKAEFNVVKANLDEQKAELGGHLAASKIGDAVLKYAQVKGMAINPISGSVNLLIGWMENCIKAADGRYYSQENFNKSLREAFAVSLNPSKSSELAKKYIAIEQLFNISGKQDVEYRGSSKLEGALYFIQDKTEFVNVMSQACAFLRGVKVKDDKGKDSNLFEAIDADGKIKSGWSIDDKVNEVDKIFDIKMKLDALRKKTHGNYTDPLKIKTTVIGRMAMQFRTWIPEMYEARWGSEKEDLILGENVKGRWRSMAILKGSEFNGNQFSALDNSIYTMGQLCKKLAFMNTDFDGRMSAVDAANMKANLMELHFLIGSIVMCLILGAGFNDEEKKRFRINALINLLTRQQSDIAMFANPLEAEKLSKNFLPITGVLADLGKIAWAAKQELSGKGEYKNGTYKGMDKLAVSIIKNTPIANQALRVYQYGKEKIDK